MSVQQPSKVDRQTTTPFLLKLFYKSGAFHRQDEFTPTSQPSQHLQIYTWPTCTLRELTILLTSALPSLLPSPAVGTRVAFRLIFPDTRPPSTAQGGPGRFMVRELGSVVIGASASDRGENGDANGNGSVLGIKDTEGEAEKMLQDVKFVIGDCVCCAIYPPLANGAVAPPPSGPAAGLRGGYGGGGPPRGGYGGGMRENGYGDGGYSIRGRGARGAYGGGGDFGRLQHGRDVPSGEWRRGEHVPDGPGYRGGGGGYRGGRGRGW